MGREVPIHYLRHNAREWTPPALFVFDVETDEVPDGDRLILKTVWWSALETERRGKRNKLRPPRWHDGTTPLELAQTINDTALQYRSLWCYAHNLNFDATVTSLPLRLAEMGWIITEFSLRGTAPWFRLRKNDHGLVLTDSYSWLPEALETIGKRIGIEKPPLPEVRGDNAETMERCRTDVAITSTAILDLIEWWDREKLGNWSLSGATCGWNAYRHRTNPHKVTIDPDNEARAFERRAIYGGYRDATRIGGPWVGEWSEWDIRNAYPTAAAHTSVPHRRGRLWEGMNNARFWDVPECFGAIAECTVTTETPGIPCRINGEIWFPTGTFRSVLAGPELAHYRGTGQASDIGPGYDYSVSPHLANWARWVLDLIQTPSEDTPEVARIAAKHWSRAVVGKWSAHTHERTKIGLATEPGWHVEEAIVVGHRGPSAVVDMAGSKWLVKGDVEPDNSFPAVTAWIESTIRLALLKAIDAYGRGRILQANTDGFLAVSIDSPGYSSLADIVTGEKRIRPDDFQRAAFDLADTMRPYDLARKADYQSVSVMGPQHVTKDRIRAYAGVPGKALEREPGTFTSHIWPKLTWQMSNGVPDAYVRPTMTAKVVGPFARRWILADGSTIPATARISPSGASELVPWVETAAAALGLPLAAVQHPRLHALR